MKDFKDLPEKIGDLLPRIKKYLPMMFGLLLAIIYGFLLFRTNTLNNSEPSQSSVAAQSKIAQVPHVDQKVINQLQSLQDNSSNVQALFDDARNNPFQE